MGVRVNPLDSVEEVDNFVKGKSITITAGRTLKRTARRNLQRYKLRRENLLGLLREHGFVDGDSLLREQGPDTTFETHKLRAKAATEEISLSELARVLLMINKKRGYKSSRKAKSDEEGSLIDGMQVARVLYDRQYTVGQYVHYEIFQKGKKHIPDFYRSDLLAEWDRIWDTQKTFYPHLLTDTLREAVRGKGKRQTWAICQQPLDLHGLKREVKGNALKEENYLWRTKALDAQLGLEELAVVLQEINGQITESSGYLGAISDRSKELIFHQQTVGQYQWACLQNNPHNSLKNVVFYRQDYLDEFERIWQTQSSFHPELTDELKREIRDVVIFYQRRLKSKKGLVGYCEFENKQMEVTVEGKTRQKTIGYKVAPKSSPLFQEFKIWQRLNDVVVIGKVVEEEVADLFGTKTRIVEGRRFLTLEEKERLSRALQLVPKMGKAEALKLLFKNYRELDMNFKELEGNRTLAKLFEAYQKIVEVTGHLPMDWKKGSAEQILPYISQIFSAVGIDPGVLHFNADLEGDAFERQPLFRLWHLLYSYEGDNSTTGNEGLLNKLQQHFGFDRDSAQVLANVHFDDDYASLSTKALRRILPELKKGFSYDKACANVGYRHSAASLTREEIAAKAHKPYLELLPHNSLRNPVVEKILNQMVHVVNGVIAEYGKPDEIRIELARELKKSAQEREEMVNAISNNTREAEQIIAIIKRDFGFTHVSKTDIVRYKLYKELEHNGDKTLYSSTKIPYEKLFSKEYEIDHIIPQSRLFDDSFSNKTLEKHEVNLRKGNRTAYDWVLATYGEEGLEAYKNKVKALCDAGSLSKAKCKKLLMPETEIPSDFINRDLRDTQYIAKMARTLLEEIVPVVVPTTGSITDRLREDWQLVNIMQELNWDKYQAQGLTQVIEGREGQRISRIKDWTKRNDHRHHAMDALTIAFTKRSYIQYLNHLNARGGKNQSAEIYAIEQKELYRDEHNKLRFNPPLPLSQFRAEARRHLEGILVSVKAKNKVMTQHVNIIRKGGGTYKKVQLTPRGQLHKESVYGAHKSFAYIEERVGSSFDEAKIAMVAHKAHRCALLLRLQACENNPKKAFTGKNSLAKNPLYLDAEQSRVVPERVTLRVPEQSFSIRKTVDPSLNVSKVIDKKVKAVLEERLAAYGNNPKLAFSNLDENPIWLNQEKGIAVKRVKIRENIDAVPLHAKRDAKGQAVTDAEGRVVGKDFVNRGNNHHVAIYQDAEGGFHEKVVSFYEATARVSLGLPAVDRDYKKEEGWKLLFTMKQNEYFVFPNEQEGFLPQEVDLMDPENNAVISKNLYRVQNLSQMYYCFRHHLETSVENKKELLGITYKRLQSLKFATQVVKVRINHLGQVVGVGEY